MYYQLIIRNGPSRKKYLFSGYLRTIQIPWNISKGKKYLCDNNLSGKFDKIYIKYN